MKIAVPVAGEKLCMHFGHCEKFILVDVDESKHIVKKEEVIPPPHEPGLLPKWLHEKGATIIIAGGMGMRAQQLFAQSGIQVVTGAPAEHPQTVILSWLKGELVTGSNVCDH
jgi:predicted Fe-Mo cluster-binding NifX family protein